MKKELEFIRELTWEKVFEFWRESEGEDSEWALHAKERGFDSWEEWRKSYVPALRLDERS